MKILAILFLTTFATQAFQASANPNFHIENQSIKSSQIETKTIALEHFNSIASDMVFDVEVVKSNEEKVVIKSNYLQFVEVNVKNSVLKIAYRRGQSLENVDTKIIVYAKDIKSVSAGIGSVVKIKDDFDIQKFSTVSEGKIYGDSNAKKSNNQYRIRKLGFRNHQYRKSCTEFKIGKHNRYSGENFKSDNQFRTGF